MVGLNIRYFSAGYNPLISLCTCELIVPKEINHDDWLRRAGIPSDGLKYQRVSLGNPQFAAEFSTVNPKAGLAFPFEVLISEDYEGEVDLVFHIPSLLIMTLIKDYAFNFRFMEMDVSFTSVLQRVASGVAGAENQENGGHENGGHENGGHENGGHENGGHENGGHENGGDENGAQQNRRREHKRRRSQTSAGHEFGQCENGTEEHGGLQKGDVKNEGTENEGQEDARRPTLGGHEIERFRPIREEIEARWMATGAEAILEEE